MQVEPRSCNQGSRKNGAFYPLGYAHVDYTSFRAPNARVLFKFFFFLIKKKLQLVLLTVFEI